MADEFDEFTKDLLDMAKQFKGGKYAKRHMKNQGKKMAKEEKNEFLSSGAGAGSGMTEEEIKKTFKAGRVFKDDEGDLSCRGYSSHPLTHLLDKGFIHKPDGKFVPGYHFIDDAKDNFEDEFIDNTEDFLDKMLDKYGM
ncbi:MAG: hypothetical protein FH753_00985 [Firmicutes bacterium]|nr:hypothetical protein [Bacillota bacterium]